MKQNTNIEKLYINDFSSDCISIVCNIKLSENENIAVIKEYDDEPFYYLSSDYKIHGNSVQIISGSKPFETLEQAEKALVEYSLKKYNLSENEDSYLTLHNQLSSYFDENKIFELLQNSESQQAGKYMSELYRSFFAIQSEQYDKSNIDCENTVLNKRNKNNYRR